MLLPECLLDVLLHYIQSHPWQSHMSQPHTSQLSSDNPGHTWWYTTHTNKEGCQLGTVYYLMLHCNCLWITQENKMRFKTATIGLLASIQHWCDKHPHGQPGTWASNLSTFLLFFIGFPHRWPDYNKAKLVWQPLQLDRICFSKAPQTGIYHDV